MVSEVVYASSKMDWGTPVEFYEELDREFHFDMDACATEENAKCPIFITPEQNALKQPWHGTVWMNPPYGRELSQWVLKAWQEMQRGCTTVMLVPARTDTNWWATFWDHNKHCPRANGGVRPNQVRFIKGRLRFEGAAHSAPFPSAVVILRGMGDCV